MEWLLTALTFAFWFAVSFAALAWLASRLWEKAPGGPTVLVVLALASGFVAYTMAIHPPEQTDCVDETPQGRGRC